MSLILEALKKSEAERRLGEAPSLSTVPNWKPQSRASGAWWLLLPALAIAVAAAWSNRDLLGNVQIAEEDSERPNRSQPGGAAPVPKTAGRADWTALDTRPTAERVPAPPAPAERASSTAPPQPMPPPPMPQPMPPQSALAQSPPPQSMDDLDAMKGISQENQRRIRSGELFVPSPSLLAERGPTTETPIISAESALPPPLPDPVTESDSAIASDAAIAAAQPMPMQPPQAAVLPASPVTPGNASANGVDPAGALITAPALPAANAAMGGTNSIHDLTLAQRQGLPPLKMSMHVYHRDVTRRFVIIDGQRLNEGGVMGNETWAREIVPDGAIIEYKNIRFLLPRLGG